MVNSYIKKKTNFLNYLMYLVLIAVVGAIGFLMISPQFEQEKPKIKIADKIYWNLKTPLNIEFSDNSGIKYYKITYNDGVKSIDLNTEVLSGDDSKVNIKVNPPKLDMFYSGKDVFLDIEVVDNSKWNFLEGNKVTKKAKVIIDVHKPVVDVISSSRYIRRGGSAIAIVNVKDLNLEESYISFNDEIRFELSPFYKDDYFVSLIAWDVSIENFKRVNLVAIDKAGNKTITKIPLFIQPLIVKKDNIKISENFIESVSSNVLEQSGEAIPLELPKRFIEQNRVLRDKNIKFLRKVILKQMDLKKVDNFTLKPFKRLKGSRKVAGYGERRTYLHNEEKIDEAWHLGLDFASVKKAPIRSSNAGKVIFNDYLGIYGNTIIIDHQLGLSSLYAHTTSSYVQLGDIVKAKKKIANTGTTGAVMGDHLHFGILVQGIEVNPQEWMDRNWIKTYIIKVINKAKKEIDG